MKVSVVIPCYNVEKYIKDCIGSVEAQTHSDLEIICINDGSTDRTLALLKELASKSNREIHILDQPNAGAATARNKGISHSNGFYIQFLDADDLLLPDKIANQILLAQANDSPDVIVGSYQRINMKQEILLVRKYNKEDSESLWLHLLKTDLGNTCANLFKKDCFTPTIQWNKDLSSSQEYNLMFELMKADRTFIFDPMVNTTIRVRVSGSISQQNLSEKWRLYVELRIQIIDYLNRNKPKVVDFSMHQFLFDCIRMLYPYQPALAIAHFRHYLPAGFVPGVSSATGKMYVTLFRFFGFERTEKIRQYFSKNKAH